jgi:hypothetical protein
VGNDDIFGRLSISPGETECFLKLSISPNKRAGNNAFWKLIISPSKNKYFIVFLAFKRGEEMICFRKMRHTPCPYDNFDAIKEREWFFCQINEATNY